MGAGEANRPSVWRRISSILQVAVPGPSLAVLKPMRARIQSPNELPPAFPRAQPFESAPRDSDGPMTLSQASYLMMLCEETGELLDDSLTQAEAVDLIHALERATGRTHTAH